MSLQSFLSQFPIAPPDPLESWSLARDLCFTYQELAATASDQFIPVPLLERDIPSGAEKGRCLAIDIGGTNLRVGVIELLGNSDVSAATHGSDTSDSNRSRIRKTFERSWHIGEEIKDGLPQRLFSWLGACVAEVIRHEKGFPIIGPNDVLPVGITFSFPMIQKSLTEAKIMSMNKGFTLASDLDLGHLLNEGYEEHRKRSSAEQMRELPKLRIAAIVNDAVATFITTNYDMKSLAGEKILMSFVCATGTNATVSLPLRDLGSFKLPTQFLTDTAFSEETEVVVNTEWAYRGASKPLMPYITKWDLELNEALPIPGQQPYDYLTAGRYLGELARLVAVDFFVNHIQIPETDLPLLLRTKHGLTTTFIGNLASTLSEGHETQISEEHLVTVCETELPGGTWKWDFELANVLREISLRVRLRATMLTASAIMGMLLCIRAVSSQRILGLRTSSTPEADSDTTAAPVLVGYTGGCIMQFPNYLTDVQRWLDKLTGDLNVPQSIELVPVLDGGILGAGILACKVATTSMSTLV